MDDDGTASGVAAVDGGVSLGVDDGSTEVEDTATLADVSLDAGGGAALDLADSAARDSADSRSANALSRSFATSRYTSFNSSSLRVVVGATTAGSGESVAGGSAAACPSETADIVSTTPHVAIIDDNLVIMITLLQVVGSLLRDNVQDHHSSFRMDIYIIPHHRKKSKF